MTAARQVVVNADDLGMHPAVQRAVDAAAARGPVTSASLVANGPCVREARSLAGISFGAHLNVLRGRPLSPPAEVPTLVDGGGNFLGSYGALFGRYLARRLSVREVELEWSRQVEHLLSLGFVLSHADSEKHVHAWPRLMSVACRVAARFGIGWVRWPLERTPLLRWDKGSARTRFLSACALGWREPRSVRHPDGVWGIADQGPRLDPLRFRRYIARNPGTRRIEIVCHPGDPRPQDPPLAEGFGGMRVWTNWESELRALRDPRWSEVLSDEGFTAAGFDALA